MTALVILAGDTENAAMPTEAEWAKIRGALNGEGVLRRAVATTLPDGSDAIELEMARELEYGAGMVVYTLAVPKGDNAFMMSYLVMDEAGDPAGWSALTASVRHTGGGLPVWAFGAAGVFVLGLLVFFTRGSSRAPVGRVVVPDAGYQSPAAALTPSPLGKSTRPAFGGQMPAARGATPSMAYAPPAAAPPVLGARTPEPAPQIPGLRSTLPPSGQWGK